jgi:hypothetical protein
MTLDPRLDRGLDVVAAGRLLLTSRTGISAPAQATMSAYRGRQQRDAG